MEKRITDTHYKVVLDENDTVVWACGRVPWDKYVPNEALQYVNLKGTVYFTTEKCIYPIDYKGKRGQPIVRGAKWIRDAYLQGVI